MLTLEEIKEIIKNGETNRVEFKSEKEKNIDFLKAPIKNGTYADLNERTIYSFFNFRRINPIDISIWESDSMKNFLKNKEILVDYRGELKPTVAGALLFAKKPFSLLGFSGITITKYPTDEKGYDYIDARLDNPVINTLYENGDKEANGLIDEALDRIKIFLQEKSNAYLDGATRVVSYPYPMESIRETIVNAVAHRDYTISGLDIRIDIFPGRLEIESPGRLPNTITLDAIKVGAKYYRNQILVQYLKESGFMDLHSLGIPNKILKLCTDYTGKVPELEESENSFKVTLFSQDRLKDNEFGKDAPPTVDKT